MFVSDLDGTLVKSGNIIEASTLEKLHKIVESGCEFYIATGRHLESVQELVEKYNLPVSGIILLNGAILTDGKFAILSKKTIAESTLKKLLTYVNTKTLCKLHYVNVEGECCNAQQLSTSELYSIHIEIDSQDEILCNRIFEEVYEQIHQEANAFRNLNFIDVAPLGCSKGEGVNFFQKIKEELYCIGDSYNDISMIEKSEFSATFQHAQYAIKQCAHMSVKHIDEYLTFIEKRRMNNGY